MTGQNSETEAALIRLNKAAVAFVGHLKAQIPGDGGGARHDVQIYVPITITGTDIRVLLESGPRTAEINRFMEESSRAGRHAGLGKQGPSEAIRSAVSYLLEYADALRERHLMESGAWNKAFAEERCKDLRDLAFALGNNLIVTTEE